MTFVRETDRSRFRPPILLFFKQRYKFDFIDTATSFLSIEMGVAVKKEEEKKLRIKIERKRIFIIVLFLFANASSRDPPSRVAEIS